MRYIFLLLFVLFFSLSMFSDNSNDCNLLINNQRQFNTVFDLVLKDYINKDITVTLGNIETTISGTLLEIYADGIILKTLLNDKIFIARSAIAIINFRSRKNN